MTDINTIEGSVAKDKDIIKVICQMVGENTKFDSLLQQYVPVLEFLEMKFLSNEIRIDFVLDDTLFGIFNKFSIRFYPVYGHDDTIKCVLVAFSDLADLEDVRNVNKDRLIVDIFSLIATLTEDMI